MSTTFMTEPIVKASPRSVARTAGAFWFITFLMGLFAMFSFGTFVVSGNAAATAANILARGGPRSVAADQWSRRARNSMSPKQCVSINFQRN